MTPCRASQLRHPSTTLLFRDRRQKLEGPRLPKTTKSSSRRTRSSSRRTRSRASLISTERRSPSREQRSSRTSGRSQSVRRKRRPRSSTTRHLNRRRRRSSASAHLNLPPTVSPARRRKRTSRALLSRSASSGRGARSARHWRRSGLVRSRTGRAASSCGRSIDSPASAPSCTTSTRTTF